ncbi:hypothetical protein BS47DRAFT_1296650, partial [Hydnum rufescens UP504]
ENITILDTICADGSCLTPIVIFKAKQLSVGWMQDNPLKASYVPLTKEDGSHTYLASIVSCVPQKAGQRTALQSATSKTLIVRPNQNLFTLMSINS